MFERFFGKSGASEKAKVEDMSADEMGSSDQILATDEAVKRPPTMEEMEAHAKKYAEEHGPAVFKGSEDLDTDPNTIDWVDPNTLPEANWLQGRREETMFNRENREQK